MLGSSLVYTYRRDYFACSRQELFAEIVPVLSRDLSELFKGQALCHYHSVVSCKIITNASNDASDDR
jgi:hypothetical protein